MRRAWILTFSLPAATGCASTRSLRDTESFVDPRDGQRYPVVILGGQTWMARNLAFPAEPSYEGRNDDCQVHGRLYPCDVATRACPDGWHLPSDEEWMELETFLGMAREELGVERFRQRRSEGICVECAMSTQLILTL